MRVAQILISLAVVLVIFIRVLPQIADYSAVWATVRSLTWFELLSLFVVTALHHMAVWPQLVASLPGLTLGQAAVNSQTTTAVANILPGGGMLAVGVSYAMCRSWGFADPAIGLSALITFIWNTFFRLALPVIALTLLVVQGKGSGGLILASLVGLAILVAAVGLAVTMRWRTKLAGQIGSIVAAVASFLRRIVRRPPVGDWAEAAKRFRGEGANLIQDRWLPLTLSTAVTHLALYGVMVLAVRDVGISGREVTWAQILGVFAFVRLLSVFPITPGGLGIVDLGYIGGLVLAGRDHADVPMAVFHAQVAAAVLVFRAFTLALQLPQGALAYAIWQRRKSWRRS